MKILQFRAEKLHGYLTFTLDIRPELTFLTGINGSGKTSAVRAITALLTPSIFMLANMEYEAVSVTVLHNEKEFTVRSQRSDEDISLACTGVQEPLRLPILKIEAYESRSRFVERQREFYREQESINIRNPVLEAIEKLPTPMFLDLERRHQEGVRVRRDLHRAGPANPLAGSVLDSLYDAQALGEQTYRRYLAAKSLLTDALKQDIILAAFKPIKEDGGMVFGVPPALLKKLDKNEALVNQSLSQIGISSESIEQTVVPFFERVRQISKKLPTEKQFTEAAKKGEFNNDWLPLIQEWSALQPQVQQVNHLAERIALYNTQLAETFAPIQRYLTSVNGFLADSNKILLFDPSGNFRVVIKDEDGVARSISALSSGERQLVVILTHLAFNRQAQRANILIIDEPELSLHLRWQEQFVDALTSASPGLQSILATHSPSIIKGRLADCIDVEEARRNDSLLS